MTDTTEVDDLVKRLRDPAFGTETTERNLMDKAADRIDALAAKLAEVEASSQGWIDAAVEQQVRRKRAEARLLEVEAERDAFASNIPDAAQNLIRNAHTGRLKALHRAEAAEARIAHLENHIEAVAKDTHKIMVNLATPLDDPRVKALVEAVRHEREMVCQDFDMQLAAARAVDAALSALEENK